jgi:hypothetical protein
MADYPMIYSAPMVRALLDGRKTQTRRVLKEQRHVATPAMVGGRWQWQGFPGAKLGDVVLRYAPGDRLWVKEAWRTGRYYDDLSPFEIGGDCPIKYEADGAIDLHAGPMDGSWGRYRHARFMPRWASRLTLPVREVRAQRVQDISAEDAVAEGVNPCLEGNQCPDGPHGGCCAMYDPKGAYADLWNSLHAKPKPVKGPDGKVSHYVSYPWEEVRETRTFRGLPWIVTGNPWVAAYTLTVQRGNIDGGKA